MKNKFLLEMKSRGYLNQCTDLNELDETIDGIIVTNIFGNIVDIEKYEKWKSA